MTGEQWQQAWKLYQSGSSLPPEELPAFLHAATPDAEIREAVLAILRGNQTVETQDTVGAKIGRYVLTELCGGGGMGEVYAARDTELGRSVAVKLMLSARFATAAPLDRFIREAKAASALNHPNIVTIHEVIHSASRLAIVMELVEGVSLRKMCGSPLPVDRVLHLGEQIARALETVHARGIVHCDIKPENVMVRPDGLVKVLDFGLARDMASVSSTSVLPAGTLRYMSPEQSQGGAPTPASDVFSLGIVLYELLAGTHPFDSGSIFEALQALNRAEPAPLPAHNAFVPPQLDGLIRRMLAKDPRDRPPASEVARTLGASFANPSAIPALPALARKRASRRILVWAAAAAIFGGILGTSLWPLWRGGARTARTPGDMPLVQLDLDVSAEVAQLAISPDGAQVVFLRNNQLVLRRLDENRVVPLPGTEGASYPFFAPDGKWVAYFSGGKLRKIAVSGGAPVTLCDAQSGRGGSWGDDGKIVATLKSTGGLSELPDSGGTPKPLTELDGRAAGVTSHRWPQVLPQSKGVLFIATIAGGAIGSLQVAPKSGGGPKTLVENTPYGRFLNGGYLVYYQNGKLFGAPFNLNRLEISGPSAPLVDNVAADTVRGAIFEVSLTGTLLYRAGQEDSGRSLGWLEPTGSIAELPGKPGASLSPRLAPDGKRIALAVVEGDVPHLWIRDRTTGDARRLTFAPEIELLPVWTPDGAYVVFRSGSSLAWARSDGGGKEEYLRSSNLNPLPYSFSPDGAWLAFAGDSEDTGLDLYLSRVDRTGGAMHLEAPRPWLRQAGGQYSPAISPDGRWLAYTSDESGTAEVYVTAFSPEGNAGNGKWQVSTEGGIYPVWSRRGNLLFYRSADRHVVAVPYSVKGATFQVEESQRWAGRRLGVAGGFQSFDVAPDGSRVVGIFEPSESKAETDIRVVLNLTSELRRKLSN